MSSEQSVTPKRTAGRPRAFDREAALAIALDLFWRQGFESTSTTQLTAAMGISQPSLYAAFGSKEALYREALALYAKRYGGYMSEALTARVSAREAVSGFLLGAAGQFSDRRHAPGSAWPPRPPFKRGWKLAGRPASCRPTPTSPPSPPSLPW